MTNEKSGSIGRLINVLILLAIAGFIISFIIQKPEMALNIFLVIVGFGAMIFIHELGHFIVAKSVGIKCHTFSLGFPPMMMGFQRTQKGLRFRFLPSFFPNKKSIIEETLEGSDGKDDGLIFTFYKKGKPSDTEYCVGLIPFGGYVGMLGQEDTKVAESTNDPRSYANKPVGARMAVTAAGVVFNLLGALLIFTLLFNSGIKLHPAVVGYVEPDQAADRAGIVAGDEVIAINGRENVDFMDLAMAPVLAGKGKKVELTIKHANGTTEEYKLLPEKSEYSILPSFGISRAQDLKIAKVQDPGDLYDKLGLQPGDEIFEVDNRTILAAWELEEAVSEVIKPSISLKAHRVNKETGELEEINTMVALDLTHFRNADPKTENDLTHIYSMVPRLQITTVMDNPKSAKDKFKSLFKKQEESLEDFSAKSVLKVGDIIIKAGEIEYPTFIELRQETVKYEDKKMPLTVIRQNEDFSKEIIDVEVIPVTPPGLGRPLIGIDVTINAKNAIVAKTIKTDDGPVPLEIPRGATIVAVDGIEVSSFYDVIDIINSNKGQRIPLEYRLDAENAGSVLLNIPKDENYITVKSVLPAIPLEDLKRIYKADNIFSAVSMGAIRMQKVIIDAYVTLKILILGRLSPKTLHGPVGIAHISYKIIEMKDFSFYIYFLGLISCYLAVMNFLPIPIVDGGNFLLLLIEKLKGSPVNIKIQEALVYTGLALLIALAIYVTYNDVVNLF